MASKAKTISLTVLVVLVIAAGAAVTWYYLTQSAMEEVTAPAVAKDLPVEEIRGQLKSGNFRDKLAARKQIEKLDPPDRLAVLAALLKDDAVATRLLAVSALADLGSPEALAMLADVAAKDADEKVRAAAAEARSAPAAAAPAAPPAEGGTP